jgi:hypothetical protein
LTVLPKIIPIKITPPPMLNKNKLIRISVLSFSLILMMIACKKDNPPAPPAPTPSDVDLKKGLLIYFPFDGNMADSSGNGNLATAAAGATLTFDEHGYANSAFGGTGNGERIIVTNNGSIKFDTAYTISLQFMIRATKTQAFLTMVNAQTGYGPTFATGTNLPSVNTRFDFTANDSVQGCDNFGANNGSQASDTTQFVPQPESWYNAICIYHKGSIQEYINGKLISSKSSVTGKKALLCPSSQIVIGGWWNSDPLSINGKLDEVRLYNRVLNADEISELSKDFR